MTMVFVGYVPHVEKLSLFQSHTNFRNLFVYFVGTLYQLGVVYKFFSNKQVFFYFLENIYSKVKKKWVYLQNFLSCLFTYVLNELKFSSYNSRVILRTMIIFRKVKQISWNKTYHNVHNNHRCAFPSIFAAHNTSFLENHKTPKKCVGFVQKIFIKYTCNILFLRMLF